ncbi:MAG TPA: hypothetical protein VIZ65_01755 [Cellvibrionaceae bacterium]
MAAEITLKWEWPDNRKAEKSILVHVIEFKKHSTGIFGIGKSPSLVQGFPDPYTIRGVVENKDNFLHGKTIELTLPKLEAGDIEKNSTVVLGVINNETCICIRKTDEGANKAGSMSCDGL